MGLVMDAITEAARVHDEPIDLDLYARELEIIRPVCQWTEGEWTHPRSGEKRRWNDLQNTPRDTQWLADLLVDTDVFIDHLRGARQLGSPAVDGRGGFVSATAALE